MKNIKILSIFLMLVFAFASCEKDDFTGDSSQTPTNPTITVDLGTIPTVIDGVDYKHKITLNMDVAQIVDVVVHVAVLDGGTATQDVDFAVPSKVTIPAGRTSASFEVSFFADELAEETETFKIKIGDDLTANATLVPVEVDFSIENFSTGDLKLSLSWSNLTTIYAPGTGVAYEADELADMIFTIYDIAGDSVLIEADGGSYEEIILSDTIADGDYKVYTSFYSINDQNVDSDLDFNLNFYQIGIQNIDEAYPAFLSLYTSKTCTGPHNMMIITKNGTTWTWNRYVDPLAEFLGPYGGTDGTYSDNFDWLMPSEVVTTVCGADLYIDGLNYGWMVNIWGEEVLSSTPLLITLNSDNTITVADQYYMTTLYNGAEYLYDIVNVSGTWTAGGTLHIQYEMSQGGFLVAAWAQANGYSDTDYFIADISLGAKNVVTNKTYKKIKR